VPIYHEDEPALACLAQVLGQGKNSVFYQEITKTQKALNASAFNRGSELAGEFSISLTPAPGATLADSKKLIDEAIKVFETRGVTDEDIEKFKGGFESQYINRLQSVSGKVSQLAQYQTLTGNPNMIGKELARYTSVKKEDVLRVYNKYIKGKPAVILSIATKGKEDNIVAAENYKVNTANYKAPDYGYAGLKYSKPKDSFNRNAMPGNGPNPVVKVPAFWKKNLDNGVKAIGSQTSELPIVTASTSGFRRCPSHASQKRGFMNPFRRFRVNSLSLSAYRRSRFGMIPSNVFLAVLTLPARQK